MQGQGSVLLGDQGQLAQQGIAFLPGGPFVHHTADLLHGQTQGITGFLPRSPGFRKGFRTVDLGRHIRYPAQKGRTVHPGRIDRMTLTPAALIKIQYDQRDDFRQGIHEPERVKSIFCQHKGDRQAGAQTAQEHDQESAPLVLFRLQIVLQQQGHAHKNRTTAEDPGRVIRLRGILHILQSEEQVQDLGPGHHKGCGKRA